jgi:hypothetical protein
MRIANLLGLLKKRSIIALGALILALVVIFGSFVYLNSQRPHSGNMQNVSVGMNANEVNSLIYVAQNQG